jgi:hypothetical protein
MKRLDLQKVGEPRDVSRGASWEVQAVEGDVKARLVEQ